MIDVFEARNYGCLRDVSMKLTPLHAFIGPNDSGKSTILSAVRVVAQLAAGRANELADADKRRLANDQACLRAIGSNGSFEVRRQKRGDRAILSKQARNRETRRVLLDSGYVVATRCDASVSGEFRGAMMVRFDPSALRDKSGLIPKDHQIKFFDERGRGLPGIYQAILGRDRRGFDRIEESMRRLFPSVKGLRLEPISNQELSLEAELVDGTIVPADLMSDGLLYYLGFAVIPHLARVGVVMVEEPENGLHPARIHDVVKGLREFVESSGTQVLMATHSPLVVNELKPDEVSVVTRDPERGTEVRLMKDTPNFERRSKAAELGELWLSYADGVREAPLLGDRSATQ
jgi:energy-coupling factor transporter ATP-binding protein EcfA2